MHSSSPLKIRAASPDMTLPAKRQIVARPMAVKHEADGRSSHKVTVCSTSTP